MKHGADLYIENKAGISAISLMEDPGVIEILCQTLQELVLYNIYILPDIRLANDRHSFSYAAPAVWNSLTENIRGSETVVGFRKLLKTFLFPL